MKYVLMQWSLKPVFANLWYPSCDKRHIYVHICAWSVFYFKNSFFIKSSTVYTHSGMLCQHKCFTIVCHNQCHISQSVSQSISQSVYQLVDVPPLSMPTAMKQHGTYWLPIRHTYRSANWYKRDCENLWSGIQVLLNYSYCF